MNGEISGLQSLSYCIQCNASGAEKPQADICELIADVVHVAKQIMMIIRLTDAENEDVDHFEALSRSAKSDCAEMMLNPGR